ncbi:MAG: hypothetical protein LDL37_09935 [Asticcacaulis sp.]|uniref:hypothetical protein n=1 Tax=Asticcacaulis sp. TaxID=1872648 RepID=UPI0025C60487|nr:hypothetical protein [Asticcacaulis sp.]MCA1935764.1 hypothetical protein [Asticcacaulis sp.]
MSDRTKYKKAETLKAQVYRDIRNYYRIYRIIHFMSASAPFLLGIWSLCAAAVDATDNVEKYVSIFLGAYTLLVTASHYLWSNLKVAQRYNTNLLIYEMLIGGLAKADKFEYKLTYTRDESERREIEIQINDVLLETTESAEKLSLGTMAVDESIKPPT